MRRMYFETAKGTEEDRNESGEGERTGGRYRWEVLIQILVVISRSGRSLHQVRPLPLVRLVGGKDPSSAKIPQWSGRGKNKAIKKAERRLGVSRLPENGSE